MTEEQAGWVREQVWPEGMRGESGGRFSVCPCQYRCQCRCGYCPRGEALVRPIGTLLRPGGVYGACFPEPFEHPTPTAVGAQRTGQAQIWYADRTCRWICECPCHEPPARLLAWVVSRNLLFADATVDDLTPPAYRAYAAWRRTAEVVQGRRVQQEAVDAQWWAQVAASRAAEQQRRDRRDRIRAWAIETGHRVGRSLPPTTITAYEVAEEGQDGQPALF